MTATERQGGRRAQGEGPSEATRYARGLGKPLALRESWAEQSQRHSARRFLTEAPLSAFGTVTHVPGLFVTHVPVRTPRRSEPGKGVR